MNKEFHCLRDELERICRVSDMLCTGHASLRDRYSRRALLLDFAILGLSTWLVALAFVEPKINITLTPLGWDPQIWVGILGIGVFFLSIIQLKTDWKGRSDAHKRTLDIYAEVKREARYLISTGEIGDDEWRRVLARYDIATAVGIEIPEKEFLCQKRRHKTKVELSRHLDEYPTASLLLTYIRFWARDNFRIGRSRDETKPD